MRITCCSWESFMIIKGLRAMTSPLGYWDDLDFSTPPNMAWALVQPSSIREGLAFPLILIKTDINTHATLQLILLKCHVYYRPHLKIPSLKHETNFEPQSIIASETVNPPDFAKSSQPHPKSLRHGCSFNIELIALSAHCASGLGYLHFFLGDVAQGRGMCD